MIFDSIYLVSLPDGLYLGTMTDDEVTVDDVVFKTNGSIGNFTSLVAVDVRNNYAHAVIVWEKNER